MVSVSARVFNKCLQTLGVKVIISLRSDFILDIIQNQHIQSASILHSYLQNQDNYYRLYPLTPESAYQLVIALNQHCHPVMDKDLIQKIIVDLTINGQILPLQLKNLLAQIQTEGITTLCEYQKYGQQNRLTISYRYGTIAECGYENRELTIHMLQNLEITPQTHLEIKTKMSPNLSNLLDTSQFENIYAILASAGIITITRHKSHYRYQLAYTYLYEIIQEHLV